MPALPDQGSTNTLAQTFLFKSNVFNNANFCFSNEYLFQSFIIVIDGHIRHPLGFKIIAEKRGVIESNGYIRVFLQLVIVIEAFQFGKWSGGKNIKVYIFELFHVFNNFFCLRTAIRTTGTKIKERNRLASWYTVGVKICGTIHEKQIK